ncbi:hypothetical protein C8J56DRAFT_326830 [Mycena floridula]|nr:hypothetical protein C8J56DRAFT_326830 [Mycena floridula]
MSSAELSPPRINSALSSQFLGKVVRLPCLVKTAPGPDTPNSATVESSDGGLITIQIVTEYELAQSAYFEIIGNVIDATTIRMLSCIYLGAAGEIDMPTINQIIVTTFSHRFREKFFQ